MAWTRIVNDQCVVMGDDEEEEEDIRAILQSTGGVKVLVLATQGAKSNDTNKIEHSS